MFEMATKGESTLEDEEDAALCASEEESKATKSAMTGTSEVKTKRMAREKKRARPTMEYQGGGDDDDEHGRMKMQRTTLPFVSPERKPRRVAGAENGVKRPQLMRTPLQVRASSKARPVQGAAEVQQQVATVRKKLKTAILQHKANVLSKLEERYTTLRKKVAAELEDAEQQLQALRKANDTINELAERKLQVLTKMAATEIMWVQKTRLLR
ncbi:hypothetical protein Poli38472_004682 [Pythium oligandrum]|uniref:Uncharacterized protein n=1 Tax=Pythium oligandrum TaxID=41045 RepID=A0A8K1CAW3_PYTOL|nr:hypothetical protein Poli38472_004682 [Pythium oligandrum]|eukprot:TMW59613.1 hypothetical protein Poli38472_004682 [Pythium oligandrum]